MERLSAKWKALFGGLLLILGATFLSCSTPKPPTDFDVLAQTEPCSASWNLRYEALVGDACYQKRLVRAVKAGCKADENGRDGANCKIARMLDRTSKSATKNLAASQLDLAVKAGCEAGNGDACALAGRKHLADDGDAAKALALFSRGCEHGSAASCFELYTLYRGQDETATFDKNSELLASATTQCRQGVVSACELERLLAAKSGESADDAVCEEGATACYERACRHGQASACTQLATILQGGEGADEDVTGAFNAYERACAMGDWAGCGALGRFYERGIVVPRDFAIARSLFQWACAPQNPSACVHAGRMFAEGLGGSRDAKLAESMFSSACASGSASGCRKAADVVVRRDTEQGTELFSKACELGDGQSCTRLAHLEIESRDDEADDARIAELFQSACDAGYADGCREGATRFYNGDGVSTDERRAAELAGKACDLGSLTHCWSAADSYRFGYGVEVDRVLAKRFIELSIEGYKEDCKKGIGRACHNAAHAIAHGYPQNKRLDEAQDYLNKACEDGAEDACREVAVQHITGEIFPVDRAHGLSKLTELCEGGDTYMCIRLASELSFGAENEAELERAVEQHRRNCLWRGDNSACSMLGRHYQGGQGVDKDLELAYRYASQGCSESEEEAQGCPVATSATLRREPSDDNVETLPDTLENLCVYEGHDIACTPLARIYETGFGVKRDTFRALSLYERVCDADTSFSAEACSRAKIVRLAHSRENDEDADKDSAKALQKACEGGAADSCALLARHHEFGSAEPDRFEAARTHYRKACELGNADSCTVYAALAYEDGAPWGRKFQDELLWACERGTAQMCNQWAWNAGAHRWELSVKLKQHACAKGMEKSCRSLQENLEPRELGSGDTDESTK